MQLESLNCNNCGAPLSVPETANFIKCNHCDARLAIRRSESTTSTEQLQELTKQTGEIKEIVTNLARQNKVAAIDRQWEREKERFMVTDKHGHRNLPSEGGAIFGGVIAAVVGTIWTIMASGITQNSPFSDTGAMFPLFGVLFIVVGISISILGYNKAKDYKSAQRRYRRRRTAGGREDVFEPSETNEEFLKKLEEMPTPEEYLRDLGEQ